jgi:putative ABC transport system ATP-binding protein
MEEAMKGHTILEGRNLVKRYTGSGRDVIAVNGTGVSVETGEFLVIMGSSGSGKSSLLFLLSGLEKPETGEVEFKGNRIEAAGAAELAKLRQKEFGFVFQGIHLVPYLTLMENVRVAALAGGAAGREASARAEDLMERFGLLEARAGLPSRVSGGEAQRAAVARAVVNRPALLFADEPTGALNHQAGKSILDEFAKLNREGQTIVMVTHDLGAAAYGNRVAFMRDGRIDDDLSFEAKAADEAERGERRMRLVSWLAERGW